MSEQSRLPFDDGDVTVVDESEQSYVSATGRQTRNPETVNTDAEQGERGTPEHVIQTLIGKMGGLFDLDTCSGAQLTEIAEDAYTEADDGLSQPWHGKVWSNPPYGELGAWMEKAATEAGRSRTEFVLVLFPSYSLSTRCFHNYTVEADVLCMIEGRLSFGNTSGQAGFSSLIAGFGDVPPSVMEGLRELGAVYRPEAGSVTRTAAENVQYLFELDGIDNGEDIVTTETSVVPLQDVQRKDVLRIDVDTRAVGVPGWVPDELYGRVVSVQVEDGFRSAAVALDGIEDGLAAVEFDVADGVAGTAGLAESDGYLSVAVQRDNDSFSQVPVRKVRIEERWSAGEVDSGA